jgi:hypothetical protein
VLRYSASKSVDGLDAKLVVVALTARIEQMLEGKNRMKSPG